MFLRIVVPETARISAAVVILGKIEDDYNFKLFETIKKIRIPYSYVLPLIFGRIVLCFFWTTGEGPNFDGWVWLEMFSVPSPFYCLIFFKASRTRAGGSWGAVTF